MKKVVSILFLSCFLLFAGCVTVLGLDESVIPINLAAQYFSELHALHEEDGGALWGVSLHTPFVFVDPETREIVASHPDSHGILLKQGDVYVGKLPEHLPAIYSTPYFGGRNWAMWPWEIAEHYGDDATRRLRSMSHLSFHVLQPELFGTSAAIINSHMDETYARISIQLEINALIYALRSTGAERLQAIHDALSIRAERRRIYPDGSESENLFEIHEGLAQYTEFKLDHRNGNWDAELMYIEMMVNLMKHHPSLVGMFGYYSGALYGFLLDGTGIHWREGIRYESDLGFMLREAAGIDELTSASALNLNPYGYAEITAFETERIEIQERFLLEIMDDFTYLPTLRIPSGFGAGNMTINVMQMFRIPDWGQVFGANVILPGEFGRLDLYDGFLVGHGSGYAMVLASDIVINGNRITGPGWELELNDGFGLQPDGDDFIVIRSISF